MPQLGQTMEEGVINKWLKKEGDKVEKGEVVLEIATDKANLEVESFYRGYLRKILYKEGEKVPVTKVIAILTDKPDEPIPPDYLAKLEKKAKKVPTIEEKVAVEKRKEKEGEEKRIKASPLAKKIAKEKGIDLSQVKGTGPGGRITREDVLNFLKEREAPKEEIPQLTRVRQIVAERMIESKRNIPHFYLSLEVDMSQAQKLKEKTGVSFNDIVIKAVGKVLTRHPWMRAFWEEGKIKVQEEININFAVATDEGLYAPVIKEVDKKTLLQVSRQAKELSEKARRGKLSPQEMEGGVFTVSNLGMWGIESFSAIINPPQAGILAVGEVKKKVVVIEDMLAIRPVMKVVLSCDHRVIDGLTGASFLKDLKEVLEKGEIE